MNLKSRTILLFTPVIMIPVLLLAVMAYNNFKESAEAHLDTHVTTLLDQIARQSFDAEFFDKTQLLASAGGKANTGTDGEAISREMALHLFSLENTVKTSTIGESGYLVVIDSLGKLLFLPDNVPPATAETNLRLLGEKIAMEDSKIRAEINVDGNALIAYWKELASGMNVVAFVPETELNRHGAVRGMSVMVMAITLTLFMVVLVLMVLRYLFIKPVDALNVAAKNISRGHFDVDINVDRDDEIGQLSKAFVAVSKDLKQTHEDASYIARHDSLTGLPNRVMFDEYIENIVAMARTKQHRVALLFITAGNLKQVNENHGQDGGDALIREMATRLNSSLRKSSGDELHDKPLDMVCRYGGNEFIILLDNIDGAWDATVVSDRILNLLQHPVQFSGADIDISCSIGITIFPDDSVSAQELIKNADIAMYRAREQGKNHYEFYSEPMNERMHRHMRIHSRLRSGFDADQFFMDYQPKMRAVSREIVGIEALIRWQDPEVGLISPDDFLPIANDSGLLPEITRWTIEHVCTQAMEWFSTGRLAVPVAVNISAIEFKRFDLLAVIKQSLETSGLPAELLELELSEASIQDSTEEVTNILTSLNKLGVRLTLNSYGKGYSSLNYLKQLPIDTLKIDRTFVAEIKSLGDNITIINAIIALGQALNLSIVADGVETDIQRKHLKSDGCDVMQGFLFCKPLSTDAMTAMLDELLVADE